jgi:hypothetical protein
MKRAPRRASCIGVLLTGGLSAAMPCADVRGREAEASKERAMGIREAAGSCPWTVHPLMMIAQLAVAPEAHQEPRPVLQDTCTRNGVCPSAKNTFTTALPRKAHGRRLSAPDPSSAARLHRRPARPSGPSLRRSCSLADLLALHRRLRTERVCTRVTSGTRAKHTCGSPDDVTALAWHTPVRPLPVALTTASSMA